MVVIYSTICNNLETFGINHPVTSTEQTLLKTFFTGDVVIKLPHELRLDIVHMCMRAHVYA